MRSPTSRPNTPGIAPLLRDWYAEEDLAAARRGIYELSHQLATGVTAQRLIGDVTVLMDALADDEAWLLSPDPKTWRYLMVDNLHTLFNQFCILVAEPALWAPR